MVARKPSKLDDFTDFINHTKFQPLTSPSAIWQAMKAINDLWPKKGKKAEDVLQAGAWIKSQIMLDEPLDPRRN